MKCDYQNSYQDFALLVVARPTWTLSEIRRLSVRERKFWLAYFKWLNRVRESN